MSYYGRGFGSWSEVGWFVALLTVVILIFMAWATNSDAKQKSEYIISERQRLKDTDCLNPVFLERKHVGSSKIIYLYGCGGDKYFMTWLTQDEMKSILKGL